MHQNGFTTTIVHSDRDQSAEHGAVHKPMHPSSEYVYEDARELAAVFQGKAGFTYARQGTPTTTALEARITRMEAGKSTVSFATGMAALAAIFTTLLRRGDHLVSSQYVFGNTNSLLNTLMELGVEVTMVDATDVRQVRDALRPNTRMVSTETIANPGTQIADLAGMGELCRERGLVYVVDNTLTSPWMFRPVEVGASLVMNSLSKYIAGHGHALGGAVTDTGLFDWSGYANIYESYRKGAPTGWGLTQIKKKGLRDMGGTLAAEPAHRIAIGTETLALRMARHCSNALALATFLQGHPGVARVHYPGLSCHAQHQRASALFDGRYGGLLGVELAEGIDCFDFLNRLRIVLMATHLGDTRSLALPAAHTIYYEMGAEKRAQMGIADSLIRVSVGIEDEADLLFDFDQALRGCLQP
ncbi:cystathionine gamma-synthase family protein [Bordetella bronchiseptica]